MNLDGLKDKELNIQSSTLNILMKNNALLESIADLIIKISAKDDDHKNELSDYFNKKIQENFKNTPNLLDVDHP